MRRMKNSEGRIQQRGAAPLISRAVALAVLDRFVGKRLPKTQKLAGSRLATWPTSCIGSPGRGIRSCDPEAAAFVLRGGAASGVITRSLAPLRATALSACAR